MDAANGQIGGKNCKSIFVLAAFISFGLFNIFPQNVSHTSCFLLGEGEGVWIFVVLNVLMKVLTIYP